MYVIDEGKLRTCEEKCQLAHLQIALRMGLPRVTKRIPSQRAALGAKRKYKQQPGSQKPMPGLHQESRTWTKKTPDPGGKKQESAPTSSPTAEKYQEASPVFGTQNPPEGRGNGHRGAGSGDRPLRSRRCGRCPGAPAAGCSLQKEKKQVLVLESAGRWLKWNPRTCDTT